MSYTTRMRHEGLNSQEQILAEELLGKFGPKTVRSLRAYWDNIEEHFHSAVHDTAIQLARETVSKQLRVNFGLFHCIATRRLIDILRSHGIIVRKGQKPLPKKVSLETPHLSNSSDEHQETLADVILGDADDQFARYDLVELLTKIQTFLIVRATQGSRWARTALYQFFDGLPQIEIAQKLEVSLPTIGADIRNARQELKKHFAQSLDF